MMYLLATLLAVVSAIPAPGRLSGEAVENLAMEQQLLDNVAFQCGVGAYDGVYAYFGATRRIEDPTERLNHVVSKLDVGPQRRLVCAGACLAIAAAVAGGVASGVTGAGVGLIGNAFSNSVAAPQLDNQQIEMIAEVAAQGAFDAVETQFGITGVEAFGDSIAQALNTHRRPACLGVCTAVVAAVAGGVASGVAGGLIGLAASSVSAADMNIDVASVSPMALDAVAQAEHRTMDMISEIGSAGAMNAIEQMFHQ